MTRAPRVSVVLPTYNRAPLLGRAMRSVLNQRFRDLELIVVDDGSTDDTERVVRGIGDPRVRYVRQDNAGPAAARNTGIGLAQGALVAFQDSDDEWLSGKLEQQVAALSDDAPERVLCVCSYVLSRGPRAYCLGGAQLRRAGDVRHQTLENFYFPTPTWLVRRSALERAGGFDPALSCWEDWELAIRLADTGEFALVDAPLHLQYFAEGGVNGAPAARLHSMRRMLERHAPRWAATPRLLAEHRFTVGRLECLHGSIGEGRRQLRAAVQADPTHRKAWLALGLTYAGATWMPQILALRRRLLLRRPQRFDPRRTLGPRDLD